MQRPDANAVSSNGASQLDRMNSIWYWTILGREGEGFIASVPDLGDFAACGATKKEAVAEVAERAAEYVRALVENGKPVPRARHGAEMPSNLNFKFGRALICVRVEALVMTPPPDATD
jgi:predicted RNase H-like HicB family nuclease